MNRHSKAVTEILFEKGPVTLTINGNSMQPYFRNGQSVIAISLPREPLRRGGCYIYLTNGILVVHRLLWAFRETVVMAGDSNNHIEYINRKDLIGMAVSACHPAAGSIINMINLFFLPFIKCSRIFRIRSKLITIIVQRRLP